MTATGKLERILRSVILRVEELPEPKRRRPVIPAAPQAVVDKLIAEDPSKRERVESALDILLDVMAEHVLDTLDEGLTK